MSTASATKAFSGLAGAVGAAIALRGAFLPSTPHTVGGMGLMLAASTFLTLSLLRTWICDNTAERERLRHEGDKLAEERVKYVAAHAALQAERDRIRADLKAGEAAAEQRLATEREAMQDEFDNKRAELIRSTFETAVNMVQDGLLEPDERGAEVIHLPTLPGVPRAARRPS